MNKITELERLVRTFALSRNIQTIFVHLGFRAIWVIFVSRVEKGPKYFNLPSRLKLYQDLDILLYMYT